MALLRRERLGEGAVVAAAVAIFAPSLGYSLTFDDLGTVVEHPGVQGASLRDLFLRDFWGHPFGDPNGVPTYRPVVSATYWLDRHLGGGAPWVFHATNLVVYGLLLLAMFRLLRAFGGLGHRARLLTVAGFASLAIHADVVPSVTGRAELLAALFSVLALDLALRGRWRWFLPVSLLALFAKESTLPLVLAIPLVARRRSIAVGSVVAVSGALLARAAMGLPFRARHVGAEADNVLLARGVAARIPGALDVLSRYVEHTLTGLDLSPDYHYASVVPSESLWSVRPLVGLALAIAIVVALANKRLRAPLLLFLASYAVASSLIVPASAVVADRLFFLPSFFLVLAVAIALRRRRVVAYGALAFIAAQSALAVVVSRMWRDERSLSVHIVSNYPVNARGRDLRAHVAYLDGDVAMTAWELVVEAAIYNAFPRALDREAIPASWESLPPGARIDKLRALLGPAAFGAAVARGRMLAQLGGYRDAAQLIAALR